MAASCLAPTAFPPEYIHSLPTIQDLIRNVHTGKRLADQENVSDNDDGEEFILVDPPEAFEDVTPTEEIASMSIDKPPRTSPFVDMVVRAAQENAALSVTENNATTYSTSLQPLVDLFYAVKEKSLRIEIERHLGSQ